ncbi:MAG: CRISPR-associated endonuclease Cas3'' [Pontiellaceae bacterium]|nr:CRISPR-associated endonuclease Cas3'' [Pontiellaceae bacterium]
MNYYAHSKDGEAPEYWQPLEEHLNNVAKLAAEFATPFGGEEWARLAGRWHDLGKYSNEFQKMLHQANGIECHLETKPGKVVHSQAGGHLAQQKMNRGMDRIFCWLIMGHHAGLADYSADQTGAKALEPKMRTPEESDLVLKNVPDGIKDQPQPSPPLLLLNGADASFFIRMLFSCVVDADFLDTECFMDKGRGQLRGNDYPALDELLAAFDLYMDEMCRNANPSSVNRIRADVLAQCSKAAEKESSVFSLTVPTGGGKTLSSLAFALRHATKWGKKRVIYVIPYTSIIEQTAAVFRKIPGFEGTVLEHHCNVLIDDERKESVRSRLASENWDAPIVVTTAVQFFESLHACQTSRCRKLHNMADSVIIFDEAQCLPPAFLRPSVFAIRELQRHYGVTPVLCTATQPVLTKTESFDFKFREGFESVTEIIENPAALTDDLKRVGVEVFEKLHPVSYEALAESIRCENQSVLCILNKKEPDCRTLAKLLPEEQTIHLSTNMCAEHRFQTLATIRSRLMSENDPLFVISTSLVEAGVDLDFPVVYRALAGLDSIAQAAGRCNREGKLPGIGKAVVFVPEKQPVYVQSSASLAREHLAEDRLGHIFQPETFRRYFEQRFFLLGENELDKNGILGLLGGNLDFSFRTAAERLRLIDDWQLPLIVPFGEAPRLVDKLLDWDARSLFRKLQRYTISVPKMIMWQLIDEGHARELPEYPGTTYLHNKGLYTNRYGFIPPDEIDHYESETLIT